MTSSKEEIPDYPPPPYPGIDCNIQQPPPYAWIQGASDVVNLPPPGGAANVAMTTAATTTTTHENNLTSPKLAGYPLTPPCSFLESTYPGQHHQGAALVITSPPMPQGVCVLESQYDRQPNNFLVCSILTCLCFNPLFGVLAIFFSDNAYIMGDMESARKKGKMALAISITAILFTLFFFAFVVIVSTW